MSHRKHREDIAAIYAEAGLPVPRFTEPAIRAALPRLEARGIAGARTLLRLITRMPTTGGLIYTRRDQWGVSHSMKHFRWREFSPVVAEMLAAFRRMDESAQSALRTVKEREPADITQRDRFLKHAEIARLFAGESPLALGLDFGSPTKKRARRRFDDQAKRLLQHGERNGGYVTWTEFCAVGAARHPDGVQERLLEILDEAGFEILFDAEGEVDLWNLVHSGGVDTDGARVFG